QALDLFLLEGGISALRLRQVIRVAYKTAWSMLHKIRHAVGEFDADQLNGSLIPCLDLCLDFLSGLFHLS
ncbi:hypothetical protein P4H94_28635, partial [Paenibacillus macerans]|nr:hypothetical protein [Paenibacillus macerans]